VRSEASDPIRSRLELCPDLHFSNLDTRNPNQARSHIIGGSPMKRLIAALVVGIFSGLSVFSQTMKPPKVMEDLIKETERQLSSALLKGDAATVDRIVANEYVEITAQGALRHKDDVMAIVRARASAPRATAFWPEVSVEQTQFTIYDEVAVLVGVTKTKYQHMQYQVSTLPDQLPAPDTVQQERFMKVYAKRGDTWQLIASHATTIAAP
jgi:hypothetical protein